MKDVVYIYDSCLARCTDNIPHITGRSRMVHELIRAYGLTQSMECRPSKLAKKEDLLKFHSEDYINFLMGYGDTPNRSGVGNSDPVISDDEDEEDNSFRSQDSSHLDDSLGSLKNYGISSGGSFTQESLDEYGLGYDCPIFKNMGEFALRIAGGTLTAAESLVQGAKIAINWSGGWHHAQRSEASGFCYVNDIVIGIHEMQKKFKYILYIDLDAHHGDGVENAFAFSDKVMTLSFHHFESGYFPGTGRLEDVGNGRGKFCTLNVPLHAAISDQQFNFLFDSIINNIVKAFQPDAFVVQCGADCLAGDPLGAFNLTPNGIVRCVQKILSFPNAPTLLLGGGGYNIANAARLWTCLTAALLKKTLSNDIPDNKYFLKYGPHFEICVQPSLRKDENEVEYLNDVINKILGYLISLKKRNVPSSLG